MSVSSREYFTTFFVSTAVVNLSSLMPRIFDVPIKSSFGLLFGRKNNEINMLTASIREVQTRLQEAQDEVLNLK
jgi:hypothetical protein